MTEMWRTDDVGIVPEHVPPGLVRHVDLWNRPADGECPYSQVSRVQGESPRIFFNTFDPQCGSSWVLTRDDDLREVLIDAETFSSEGTGSLSALIGETWLLNPLEVDPPTHRQFRAILNKYLLPSHVKNMEEGIRERAADLIEGIKADGRCEFMSAFANRFPVGVFLQLMGLPAEDRELLLTNNNALNHDTTIPEKIVGAQWIRDYLVNVREDRRKNPRDDLATFIVQSEIDGKPLSDDDILGMYFLTTIAGLDTVASSLGQMFLYLGQHPEQQARLRDDPDIAPKAVEEMMRAFSPVLTRRKATRDVEIAGVEIKTGDWVTCITAFAGVDPERYPDPTVVDFDRSNNRHLGFAIGPHACAGVHLARREMQIALQEWFAHIREFRLDPSSKPIMKNGGVIGPERLDLVWS